MKCPRCKNTGFEPTPEIKKPLVMRYKTTFGSFDSRAYACLQCGYVYETEEKFSREIEIRGAKIMEMIENAQEVIREHKRSKKSEVRSQKSEERRRRFDMTGRDQKKLLEAGYRFYRLSGRIIKEMTLSGVGVPGWRNYSKHPNNMHAQRQFNTLMMNPKCIED